MSFYAKTYILKTYDNQEFRLSDEQAKEAIRRYTNKINIQFKDYPGILITPGNVKGVYSTQEKSQTVSLIQEIFREPSQEQSFWQLILEENLGRSNLGKIHIYANAILVYCQGMKISKVNLIKDLADIFEAIVDMPSEWLEEHNRYILASGDLDKLEIWRLGRNRYRTLKEETLFWIDNLFLEKVNS